MAVLREHTITLSASRHCVYFGPPDFRPPENEHDGLSWVPLGLINEVASEETDAFFEQVGSRFQFFEGVPGGLILFAASRIDSVVVTVRSCDAEGPPSPDPAEWEMLTLSVIEVATDTFIARTWPDAGERTPNLLEKPGQYAVQVHTRIRSEPSSGILGQSAPEACLVDIWPTRAEAPSEEPAGTSEVEAWSDGEPGTKEYTIVMAPHYGIVNFGPSEDEYAAKDENHVLLPPVGSLIQFYEDAPGGFILRTAIHTGRVVVTVRSSDASEPPPVDLTEWEDMAVSPVEVPTGELIAESWFGSGEMTPNLIDGPGTYGVRVLARNRDEPEPDDLSVPAAEFYLVDIWHAPPEGVTEQSFSTSERGKEIETWG